MNPVRSEADAFRFLILVIGVALATAAAGVLGDGWTALATLLSLSLGLVVGMRLARSDDAATGLLDATALAPGLPLLVVAPVELAGQTLAREVAAEEDVRSVRAVLLAADSELGTDASRRAAELRALLGEQGIAAQVISVAWSDAEKAVAAELRDGVIGRVFIATHRHEHPRFSAEEAFVHAVDDASSTPVVAVAFSAS